MSPTGGHPTPEQLDRYAGQTLAPDELLAVDDHLADCATCRDALAARWDVAPALAAWREIAAPATEERSPHRAWLLAASLLLLVGLGLVLREWAVARQRAELAAQLRAAQERLARLEPEVGRLQAENQKLESEVERLAALQVRPADAPGTAPRIQLHDRGRSIALAKDGSLQGLEGLSPVWRSAVAQALMQGRLPTPRTLREVRTAGSTLRSGSGAEPGTPAFSVLTPVGTVVRSDRPLFRWASLEGATGYRIVLFDRSYLKVLESDEINAQEWTPPRPLPRGEVLTWQVVARRGGEEIMAPAPPAPEARLRILSRAELRALEREEKNVSGSRLARAVLLARSGLVTEAKAELRTLARENPGSAVIERLLSRLDKAEH